MKSLEKYWYRSGFLANLFVLFLTPFSLLFCFVTAVRRKAYKLNIKKSYVAKKPLVVIGNIVVGGSGKTPLLISICEFIVKNGGSPGVVSRGYGGKVSGLKQVQENDSAELVGDEPLMIYQRTGVPVVVGADRVAAVNFLLQNTQCDIVLSDDGLQHYRMQRNLEIAVVDSSRLFGNGFCLPAGPLREPVSRLKDVDLLVYNGKHNTDCYFSLTFVEINHLSRDEGMPLSSLLDKTVHAIAGIGNPSRFFTQLREHGAKVTEHAFSDHHVFTEADFSGWQNDCIIMTEKDAVKCCDMALPDAWVIRVAAELSKALESQLATEILPLLPRNSKQ